MSFSARLVIGYPMSEIQKKVDGRTHQVIHTVALVDAGRFGDCVKAIPGDPYGAFLDREGDEICKDRFGTVLQLIPIERAISQIKANVSRLSSEDAGRLIVALATMTTLVKEFPLVEQFYVVADCH